MPSTFEGLSGVALRLDSIKDAFYWFYSSRRSLAHMFCEKMETRIGDQNQYDEAFDALAGWT